MNKTLAFTLAVVVAATFGCGKSKTYESSDGKVTVSEDGGTAKYEVKTKDGNATMAMSDSEVKIPDTFPKDVPIPKGAVAKLTMTQGKNEVLNLQVPGSIADVAKDYQDKGVALFAVNLQDDPDAIRAGRKEKKARGRKTAR